LASEFPIHADWAKDVFDPINHYDSHARYRTNVIGLCASLKDPIARASLRGYLQSVETRSETVPMPCFRDLVAQLGVGDLFLLREALADSLAQFLHIRFVNALHTFTSLSFTLRNQDV
jgi:hypothetical protein